MDWFGYTIDFPGMSWLGPVLGSVVFWWGGWPFLTGGVAEVRGRRPGMMLLITMAIVVAYGASMLTSLDVLDLEFWWELAALVDDHAARPLAGDEGDRPGPGGAGRPGRAAARRGRAHRRRRRARHGGGRRPRRPAMSCSCARAGGCRPTATSSQGTAEMDESTITGESRPVPRSEGDPVVAGTVSTDSALRVRGDRRRRRHDPRRHPAAGGRGPGQRRSGPGPGRPVRRAAVLRRHGRRADHVRGVGGARRRRRGHRPHGHRAGHRLPSRPRPRHPARDLAGHRRVGQGGHPRHRPAGPRAHAHGRRRAVRQDRHADQGRPRGHRRGRRPGVRPRRRRRSCGSPVASSPTASTRWPGPS